jgi:hypothetical protein
MLGVCSYRCRSPAPPFAHLLGSASAVGLPGHPFVQIPTIGAVAKIVTAAKSLSLIGMSPLLTQSVERLTNTYKGSEK